MKLTYKILSFMLIIILLFTATVPAYAANGVAAGGDIIDMTINIQGGLPVVNGLGNHDTDSAWNTIYERYEGFIVGTYGVAVLTCLLIFIVLFIKLGSTAGKPAERSKMMTGILISGISTALLGAIGVVFAFFYGALK